MNYRFLALFLIVVALGARAQEPGPDENTDQVKSLVDFYRYMLNTVGAAKTSARDKEVIITESYKKVFKDANVQIEDDLLPDRNAITNKNVSAYLRDVDFFFRDISFEFTDVEITRSTGENGEDYYLVSFNSIIKATTLEGEPFNSTKKRYIEVNFQENEDDLKIVSVYSTKVSREKELRNWWNSLSYEWTRIFGEFVAGDSATNNELLKIAAIDSLNISGNNYLIDIRPLSALNNLKYLNISDTRIENLEPIRFAIHLESLIAGNSRVENINLLQYFEKLEKLDLNNTPVTDLSSVGRLKQLQWINLSSVSATVFDAFQHLSELTYANLSNTAFSYPALLSNSLSLEYLDLSRTGISNIDYLGEFEKLRHLDLSETYITTLGPLNALENLETLKINQTQIFDLSPLNGMKSLRRVYCDNTGVTEKQSMDFMSANKQVLIIANTQKVMEWWEALNSSWKRALDPFLENPDPQKEDLIKLINLDSLNLRGHRLVQSDPLTKFKKLRHLVIDDNLFTDLQFTGELEYLEVLFAQRLPVESLDGLEKNRNLEAISFRGSLVTDITALNNLNKLKIVDMDDTPIIESEVERFLEYNPKVVVLYQSENLKSWWQGLPDEWKKVFDLSDDPSGLELHALIEKEELTIEGVRIVSLRPLDPFIQLTNITINNTGVTSLVDLAIHETLEEITCKNGPLSDLDGLARLRNLKKLDISNTAIDDLRPLEPLLSLETLNASGTNLKKIKGLEELINLKHLNISNTRVWQLDRLHDIRNLKSLVCYNTRVRSHEIEDLKEVFPDCEVNYY